MHWKDVSSTSVLVTSCSNSYSSVWGSIEFKIGALSMLYLSVSQYDRGLGPADWWSVWPGRFYSKSWTQWMARIWLRGLEQWELPEWICRNNVWVWPHTKLYHDEGEVRDQKSWNSPWLFSSTHLTGWLFSPLRSTATTCSRDTSKPSVRWFVTSALTRTGRPRHSPSAQRRMRRIRLPASSSSTWLITWPVPSSASSILLMPGCCSARSPSSQVHIWELCDALC